MYRDSKEQEKVSVAWLSILEPVEFTLRRSDAIECYYFQKIFNDIKAREYTYANILRRVSQAIGNDFNTFNIIIYGQNNTIFNYYHYMMQPSKIKLLNATGGIQTSKNNKYENMYHSYQARDIFVRSMNKYIAKFVPKRYGG